MAGSHWLNILGMGVLAERNHTFATNILLYDVNGFFGAKTHLAQPISTAF
jgi:hypothetical protein